MSIPKSTYTLSFQLSFRQVTDDNGDHVACADGVTNVTFTLPGRTPQDAADRLAKALEALCRQGGA